MTRGKIGSAMADHDVGTEEPATNDGAVGTSTPAAERSAAGASDAGANRRWTPRDLLWLLDGAWTATTVVNRLVATREAAEVIVFENEGGVRVTTRVDGDVVGVHEASALTDALDGVRADLREAGV
ncbi:hypothetical protein ACFPYI_16600 [Halomarina salina]|uniref:Uncharacterized protein n=1 Tax=Halomarina salina TaxID=1872699 RepID=A0ABD5RS29_9EURY|nr:hypothetical protein [Halomarina salina]